MTLTPEIQERFDRLAFHEVYGPDYDRNVAAALADARLFLSRGQDEAFEHFMLVAELRAGLYTWEQFEAIDPFLKARREKGAA